MLYLSPNSNSFNGLSTWLRDDDTHMDRQDDEKQNDMEEHADGGETFLQQLCTAVAVH